MTLDDPNRYDLVTIPACELRPGDEMWGEPVADPPQFFYRIDTRPGEADRVHQFLGVMPGLGVVDVGHIVRWADGARSPRSWRTDEILTWRRPRLDRDSDRLVADLLAAFAVERHADADVLVRQAIADFDTGTVLTALGSIATAFIHLAGRNYPGGPEALMATVQAELGGGS